MGSEKEGAAQHQWHRSGSLSVPVLPEASGAAAPQVLPANVAATCPCQKAEKTVGKELRIREEED